MEKIMEWLKDNRWVEYIGAIAVCAGLWMGSFVDKITFEMRLGQMALMIVGMAACCLFEYASRKSIQTRDELEKKRYINAMMFEKSYFSMLVVYGLVIIYAAAFEYNQLMMFMLAVLFIHIVLNGTLDKRYSNAYDLHGDDIIKDSKEKK